MYKIIKKTRETRDYYLSNGAPWFGNNADDVKIDVLVKCRNQFLDITDIVKTLVSLIWSVKTKLMTVYFSK